VLGWADVIYEIEQFMSSAEYNVKPGGRNQSSLRPRDCACCFHIFHQRAFAQAQHWCPLVLMKWPMIICRTSCLLLLLGTFVLCGKRTPVFRVVYLCTCIPVF